MVSYIRKFSSRDSAVNKKAQEDEPIKNEIEKERRERERKAQVQHSERN